MNDPMKYIAKSKSRNANFISKLEMNELYKKVIETGLFSYETQDFSYDDEYFFPEGYKLNGTNYYVAITDYGLEWFYRSVSLSKDYVVSFEKVLENITLEVAEKLLFHIDLFRRGGGD